MTPKTTRGLLIQAQALLDDLDKELTVLHYRDGARTSEATDILDELRETLDPTTEGADR